MMRFILLQKRLEYLSEIISGLKENIPDINKFKLIPEEDLIKILGWDDESFNIVKLSLEEIDYDMSIHDYIVEITKNKLLF